MRSAALRLGSGCTSASPLRSDARSNANYFFFFGFLIGEGEPMPSVLIWLPSVPVFFFTFCFGFFVLLLLFPIAHGSRIVVYPGFPISDLGIPVVRSFHMGNPGQMEYSLKEAGCQWPAH